MADGKTNNRHSLHGVDKKKKKTRKKTEVSSHEIENSLYWPLYLCLKNQHDISDKNVSAGHDTFHGT